MKALFIYYTSTGNTEYVAKLIGDGLLAFGIESTYFNAVELIKSLNLGKKDGKIEIPNPKPANLVQLENAIKTSDVIGVGSYAYYWNCAPGLADLLSDIVLPPALFTNLNSFFSFVTLGGKIGETGNVISSAIQAKKPAAKFLGSAVIFAPGNYTPFLPDKPHLDQRQWDEKEIKKAKDFAVELWNRISGKDTSVPEPFKKICFEYSSDVRQANAKHGPVKLNTSTCTKCGACVAGCPYSAITISPDKNDGFPLWDIEKCWGCCKCYNICPTESINYSSIPSCENKIRYICTKSVEKK